MNATPKNDSPPAVDELEVSLFGPGVGECVVVHIGNGDWIVIDSCLNDSQTKPIALEYLGSLGVDVGRHVRLLIVTHWHADHIRGSAELFRESSTAHFACSAALQNKEFFQLLALAEKNFFVSRDSSTSELHRIFEELDHRKNRGTRSLAGPDIWAQDGQTLIRSNAVGTTASVTALSPSSQTVMDAGMQFAKLFPKQSDQIRRFPRCTPNDLSIALLVQSPFTSILFGGDLETVGDPGRGWQAIVNSSVRPQVKGNAIKVAHHGSENGDHDGIWTTLLEANSPALLTPYATGRKPLPSDEDIQRLKSRTNRVYCTSWPPTKKPPKRQSSVERTIREVTRVHRSTSRTVGHVRLRASMTTSQTPTIEMLNGARQL